MNIAMLLTWIRILLIPVFVLLYDLPIAYGHFFSALVFAIAGITDWLDGYVARKYGMSTRLGAFLDPVADKIMVSTAIVLLVSKHPGLSIPAAVIVGREIVISALREWMAELGKRASVAVSYVGKVKTTLQIVSIIGLIWYTPALPDWFYYLALILFYAAAALTIWSMCIYLHAAWRELKEEVV